MTATNGPFDSEGAHEMEASEEGQAGGMRPCRAETAVRKEPYDHVRLRADKGMPVSRLNCSASEPSAGVNLRTTSRLGKQRLSASRRRPDQERDQAHKPSAYRLTLLVTSSNSFEPLLKVPTFAAEGTMSRKKGRDVSVMLSSPALSQVYSAS